MTERDSADADDVPRTVDPDDVYDDLADRLESDGIASESGESAPSVVAFPDGSIDYRCSVTVGAGGEIDSREAFGRTIETGANSSFRVVPEHRDPGGHAVNLAKAAHALGANLTLFGHLDHPEMPSFPFETHSMGEPATIRVLTFDDGAVMLGEATGDVSEWSFDDIRAAAPDLDATLGADAICCLNWVSIPGMTEALRRVAARASTDTDGIFVFDPGDVVGSDDDALRDLFAVLSRLADPYEVVLSANRREVRELASVLPDPPDREDGADDDRLRALRAETGIEAAVMHARSRAAAATPDGVESVPNLTVDSPTRSTGGGDRFDAALAVALASEWPVPLALAAGNAAASYYVGRDETGDRADLASFARSEERWPSR